MEEDVEPQGGPEDLRERGRDTGGHGGCAVDQSGKRANVLVDRLRQALAGHDPEVRGHVLPEDQDQRAERDHPKQVVVEVRSGGDVGCPVAGVDEPDRHEKPRPQISDHLPDDSRPGPDRSYRGLKECGTTDLHPRSEVRCPKSELAQ